MHLTQKINEFTVENSSICSICKLFFNSLFLSYTKNKSENHLPLFPLTSSISRRCSAADFGLFTNYGKRKRKRNIKRTYPLKSYRHINVVFFFY